ASPVVWSWGFQFLRLASALVLMPLVLRPSVLSGKDLGMYWAFADLAALAILFDFGFSTSIGRNVAYALAGAHELRAEGLGDSPRSQEPNSRLLWQLLRSTQRLFLYLSAAAALALAALGSITVAFRVDETSNPRLTWIAWGLVLASGVLEIYAGWWNMYLRSMNEVLSSARIAALAYALRLLLAASLLVAGAGLLAMPLAGLVSSCVHRGLSRRRCLRHLGKRPDDVPAASLIPILWPNSWRTGLQFFSVYLATKANTLLCLRFLGLEANGRFGLTAQVVGLISSMSLVWTAVKWPWVGQVCKQRDLHQLRVALWPRLWLQTLTFLVLAGLAIPIGPIALRWIGSSHQLLPAPMFLALLGYSLLETQFAFWTTLLSLMRNRIPSLWPTFITNMITVTTVVALLRSVAGPATRGGDGAPLGPETVSRGLLVLALTPLCAGLAFNFWFWPALGAREIGTRWWRFMFLKR
ncbi:MAG: hypothetical protein HYR88_15760, partial [Verrucomicrobia bacterium]|nr:hypothetical protein [Verrucomicrobiota bacterium]